jgi:CheY-like chemotaxis protein
VLDLVMPGLSGFDVLRSLRAAPDTREIPVVVSTSKVLAAVELDELGEFHASVLPKDQLAGEGGPAIFRETLVRAGLPLA